MSTVSLLAVAVPAEHAPHRARSPCSASPSARGPAAVARIARVSLGRIPIGPNLLRFIEWQLALLRGAGIPDRAAALAGDLFGLYLAAYAYEETLGMASPTGEELPPHEVLAMIRGYFESLPPAQFPNTVALVDELMAGGPDERFEFGLDVLVRGLAAQRDADAGD